MLQLFNMDKGTNIKKAYTELLKLATRNKNSQWHSFLSLCAVVLLSSAPVW